MDENQPTSVEWVQAAMREFEGPLIRYAALITGDIDRARDVVQDTFVRLCAADPDRLGGTLAQWLFTVCRNRALDVQRKESRMVRLDNAALENSAAEDLSPSDAAERREDEGAMLRLIAALPPNQGEVVRLKFHAGLSYREISQVTNLSVSNVGFLLHTAIKTIRRRLTEEQLSPLKHQEEL